MCESYDANLVSIMNNKENDFISLLISNGVINKGYWIGMQRKTLDGENFYCEWIDGKIVDYGNVPYKLKWQDHITPIPPWKKDQPDNYNNNEECVEIQAGTWKDSECNLKKGFICKKAV